VLTTCKGSVNDRGSAPGGALALFCRSTRPAVGEQLDGAVEGKRVHGVAAPQARVRRAVGDVRPEAAVLDDDRASRRGIRAQLAERSCRRALAAALRLGQQCRRLVDGQGEDLLLGVQ
jgi:hypothetical protein